MQLYSTNTSPANRAYISFEEALFKGLPDDNGLFMPRNFPRLSASFFQQIDKKSFQEIAFEVSKLLLEGEIPANDLKQIVAEAINFDAPVVRLNDNMSVLELFHGPTLAFKDFGARFMARVMSWFLQHGKLKYEREINILVATSGDTGGAVARGFFNVPNIKVTILYPSGKVSELQEKQLTTLGNNITALEIDGTFDDCQRMVKQAFLDPDLRQSMQLASANSINISRLVPQSFYYFNAYAQLKRAGALNKNSSLVFSVPSGNFGNLCAGLIAKQMGLPLKQLIAATNINDIVPQYLLEGIFSPKPSQRTISNAMDVGNPSNFARLQEFYYQQHPNATSEEIHAAIGQDITGKKYTDLQTEAAIREVYETYKGYVMCPHTAVGYLGLKDYLKIQENIFGVILATAHPAKFQDIVANAIGHEVPLPENLRAFLTKKKQAFFLQNQYEYLKKFLRDSV